MKKIIITIIAIATMMTLASCTERSEGWGYTDGDNYITVTNRIMKDGEVLEQSSYRIVYDTVQEARDAMDAHIGR